MRHFTWLGMAVLFFGALAMAPPAFAQNCDTHYYGTERIEKAMYCASSVLPASSVASYVAVNAVPFDDRLDQLAWCEDAKGAGVGEWIELRIPGGAQFRTIWLKAGYQKSKTAYYANGRPRQVLIEADGGYARRFPLADVIGMQTLDLGDWQISGRVRLTILDVYPGEKYSDTCVTSFGIDFQESIELEIPESN